MSSIATIRRVGRVLALSPFITFFLRLISTFVFFVLQGLADDSSLGERNSLEMIYSIVNYALGIVGFATPFFCIIGIYVLLKYKKNK